MGSPSPSQRVKERADTIVERLRRHAACRRESVRHRLHVPVVFSWTDEQGTSHRAEGRTRDISPAGMFLFPSACPPLGAAVGLNAFIPPFGPALPRWRMEVQGRVVRVESVAEVEGAGGFAAACEHVVVRVIETSRAA